MEPNKLFGCILSEILHLGWYFVIASKLNIDLVDIAVYRVVQEVEILYFGLEMHVIFSWFVVLRLLIFI